MDLFEKINRAFGGWYEGLFGASDDLRPKDILRRILVALEEHRKEGFDNKIYVPNQYILEIAVNDEEEKEYLLSFLDRDELETAIRRYCQQNRYQIRGALDFTIKEVEAEEGARRRDKVRIRCRYDSKLAAVKQASAPVVEGRVYPVAARVTDDEENPTVFGSAGESDAGTVPAMASAKLEVHTAGKPPFEAPITRGSLTIGRSARAGNDLVLAQDGMVSRRHARIELDRDGRYTLYDLDTTNGTRINGRKVDNRALISGDEIQIGDSRLIFRQDRTLWSSVSERRDMPDMSDRARPARVVLLERGQALDDYVLASETVIGRGSTNDIVMEDRSVATRHALIRRGEPFTIEPLGADCAVTVNGASVPPGGAASLNDGDLVGIGVLTLRFEADAP